MDANIPANDLIPDAPRRVHHQSQFRPLLVFGQQISLPSSTQIRTAGSAPDSRAAQYFAASLIRCDQTVADSSSSGTFRTDQSQDHRLALRNKRNGSNVPERASSYSSRNRSTPRVLNSFSAIGVVAALGVPVAAVVAAAKMNRQRHARPPRRLEAGVVRLDRLIEQRLRLDLHLRANPFAPLRIHEVAVARRIDLDVASRLRPPSRAISVFMISTMSQSSAECVGYTLSVTPRLNEIAGNCVALGSVILMAPGLCCFHERQFVPRQRSHGAQLST